MPHSCPEWCQRSWRQYHETDGVGRTLGRVGNQRGIRFEKKASLCEFRGRIFFSVTSGKIPQIYFANQSGQSSEGEGKNAQKSPGSGIGNGAAGFDGAAGTQTFRVGRYKKEG